MSGFSQTFFRETGGTYGVKSKDEQVFNIYVENFGHIMSQFQRRIVFALLKKNNRFPPYPNFFGKLVLCKTEFVSVFFYFIFHLYLSQGTVGCGKEGCPCFTHCPFLHIQSSSPLNNLTPNITTISKPITPSTTRRVLFLMNFIL